MSRCWRDMGSMQSFTIVNLKDKEKERQAEKRILRIVLIIIPGIQFFLPFFFHFSVGWLSQKKGYKKRDGKSSQRKKIGLCILRAPDSGKYKKTGQEADSKTSTAAKPGSLLKKRRLGDTKHSGADSHINWRSDQNEKLQQAVFHWLMKKYEFDQHGNTADR